MINIFDVHLKQRVCDREKALVREIAPGSVHLQPGVSCGENQKNILGTLNHLCDFG